MPIKHISGRVGIPKTKLRGVHLKTNKISQKPTVIKSEGNEKVAKLIGPTTVKRGSVKSVPNIRIKNTHIKNARINEKTRKSPALATETDFENYALMYRRVMDKTLYYYKKYNLQIQEAKPPTANKLRDMITKIDDNGKEYCLKRDFNRYYRKLEDLYNNMDDKKFIDEEVLMSGSLELMKVFYKFRQYENNTGGPYVVRPELKRGQNKEEAVDKLCNQYGLNNRWRYFLTQCTYTKEQTFDDYKKTWRR